MTLIFLFQSCPRGEGNCAAIGRQKLSRGNFSLVVFRCLSGLMSSLLRTPKSSYDGQCCGKMIREGLVVGQPGILSKDRIGPGWGSFTPFRGGGLLPLSDSNKGRKKHMNFFNINFLPPTQKHLILGPPETSLCASFPGKGRKKRDPHKLFRGDFWVKKGVPNRPFSATKSLVYCSFPALI